MKKKQQKTQKQKKQKNMARSWCLAIRKDNWIHAFMEEH